MTTAERSREIVNTHCLVHAIEVIFFRSQTKVGGCCLLPAIVLRGRTDVTIIVCRGRAPRVWDSFLAPPLCTLDGWSVSGISLFGLLMQYF